VLSEVVVNRAGLRTTTSNVFLVLWFLVVSFEFLDFRGKKLLYMRLVVE
jgi:hypothetical protein